MMRIEGVPAVAGRLQKALRSACQAVPCHGTTTADSDQQGKEHRGAGADRNGSHVRPGQTTDESHGQDGRHNRERGKDGRIANFATASTATSKGGRAWLSGILGG